MLSKEFAVYLLTALCTLGKTGLSVAQDAKQPEFSVSTNYVADGERVYLIGTNLASGSTVTVYDGYQREPRFWFPADTNGCIHGDITDPNFFDSAQRYNVAYGTYYTFLVSYEHGNPYRWYSLITRIAQDAGNSTNRTVILEANVNPRNSYQPQYSDSLQGRWIPVGDYVPGYILTVSNVTWTFTVPDDTASKFFRIWNPQGY
jgi:hypothetical protein